MHTQTEVIAPWLMHHPHKPVFGFPEPRVELMWWCVHSPSVLRAGWEVDTGGGPQAELAFLSSGVHMNDN